MFHKIALFFVFAAFMKKNLSKSLKAQTLDLSSFLLQQL